MKLLGIDFGSKRIGIAVSDETGRFAFPHSVVQNSKNAVNEVAKICREGAIEKIIVGESRNYKGEENRIMKPARRFAETLQEETGLPLEFENEVLTTAEASRIQGEHEKIDASAAALILKSYIDTQ